MIGYNNEKEKAIELMRNDVKKIKPEQRHIQY